jgi:hypothetical protein
MQPIRYITVYMYTCTSTVDVSPVNKFKSFRHIFGRASWSPTWPLRYALRRLCSNNLYQKIGHSVSKNHVCIIVLLDEPFGNRTLLTVQVARRELWSAERTPSVCCTTSQAIPPRLRYQYIIGLKLHFLYIFL